MKAFPKTPFVEIGTAQNGMDLRDYFAAKAMQAILDKTLSLHEENYNQYAAAQIAYQVADAMLHIRSGKPLINTVREENNQTLIISPSGLPELTIL